MNDNILLFEPSISNDKIYIDYITDYTIDKKNTFIDLIRNSSIKNSRNNEVLK